MQQWYFNCLGGSLPTPEAKAIRLVHAKSPVNTG
jgi:hypothetical protein